MNNNSIEKTLNQFFKITIEPFFCLVLGIGSSWIVKDTLTLIFFGGKKFEARNEINQFVLFLSYALVFSFIFWIISQPKYNLYEKVRKNKKLGVMVFWGLFLVGVTIIVIHVSENFYRDISYDETLYLTHMQLVMQGKIPYHDFYDWIPPVWLYVYAGVFKIFGANFIVARILSAVFGVTTIFLALRLSFRIFGPWETLVTLGLISCVNPITAELVRFYYTASALFFLFIALTIEEAFPNSSLKVIFVELFLILTAGTNQAFGLVVLLYPLYKFFICKDKKSTFVGLISCAVWGALIALPFLIEDFDATLWAMFSYNKEIMPIRNPYTIQSYLDYFYKIFCAYFDIWLPILFFMIITIIKLLFGKGELNPQKKRNNIIYLIFLFFIGISITILSLNPTLYLQQHVYYLVIGCVLTSPILVTMFRFLSQEWKVLFSIAILFVFGIQFSISVEAQKKIPDQNSIFTHPNSLESVVSTAKQYLTNKPNGKIFSFVPYLSIEAGSEIFPGTEYGITSFTMTWDDKKATRYNFFTQNQVLNWIETQQPDLIISVDKSYKTMSCCGPKGGLPFMKQFFTVVDKYYYLDRSWFINDYWGMVEFYLPKKEDN